MRRILCYGDSNTWGASDHDTRIEDIKHWPNILQQLLGSDFKTIQEGLCARVAGNFIQDRDYRNGQSHFEAIFRSASPLDFTIIALGTNDLQVKYARKSKEIYKDLLWYTDKIVSLQSDNENHNTKIIYLAPANFNSKKDYFNADHANWLQLHRLLQSSGKEVVILDDLEMSEDGIHYAYSAHQRVAEAINRKIKE